MWTIALLLRIGKQSKTQIGKIVGYMMDIGFSNHQHEVGGSLRHGAYLLVFVTNFANHNPPNLCVAHTNFKMKFEDEPIPTTTNWFGTHFNKRADALVAGSSEPYRYDSERACSKIPAAPQWGNRRFNTPW